MQVSPSVPFFQHYLSGDVHCWKYVGCLSSVTDLNLSIGLRDIINCAAFLANFGWVIISPSLTFPKAAFLLSSSHVLFLSLVFAWHSVNTCFANCIPRLHGHSGELNPGTFLKCKNFLSPIFSVLILTIRALAALQKPLCNFSMFFVSFEQIV